MAREDPTIYMRIPAEVKDALDVAAATNRRSLTAEVVARLDRSFQPNPDLDGYRNSLEKANELIRMLAASVHSLATAALRDEPDASKPSLLAAMLPVIESLATETIEWSNSSMLQAQSKALDAVRKTETGKQIIVGNLGAGRPSIYDDVPRKPLTVAAKKSGKPPAKKT